MRGCAARQRDPAAGARAAGVAPDDVADHDPPLSLHRLWARVAPGHQPGRRAAREAVASRAAMGARRHRMSALDRRPGRRGPRRVVEHRDDAVLAEGRRARRGDKYVTVIIDLTPIGTAPVRRGCWIWTRGRSKQPVVGRGSSSMRTPVSPRWGSRGSAIGGPQQQVRGRHTSRYRRWLVRRVSDAACARSLSGCRDLVERFLCCVARLITTAPSAGWVTR